MHTYRRAIPLSAGMVRSGDGAVKFSVPERPTNSDNRMARPILLAVGADFF